jgi:hypothetical protein
MKNEKIKKILAGVQTAVLVAGITLATSGCHKGSCGKGSCSSCKSKTTMQQSSGDKDPNSSCGKGSCGKGSCSK